MSDLDESGVTYTDISSPFEELSDIGSPRADDHEHLELPEMLEDPYIEVALQAPPSPVYIRGPQEPEQAPPFPDYVPGPEHADDEIVAEDQPYAKDASPTAQSPEYVPESDLEPHPEDDDDEDPEEDPVDYPADGGDDGDDEEGSSEDNEDDDMDIEADEEEEEEHPAPADSVVVASTTVDQAPSTKKTKPFKTDESAATPPPYPAYRMTAKISILAPVPMPAWSNSEIPFPPLPPILSPPSHVLSPAPPSSPIRSLGYRAAMIRLRVDAASTSHSPPLPPPFILSPTRSDAPSSGTPLLLPISASTSSPPLQLPSASRREDRPKVTLPPQKSLGIALGLGYEVGESSSAAAARPAGGLRADYDFVATMDREIMCDPEREEIYRDYRIEDSPTGIDDSPTGTGDSFAGIGYHITGTAGIHWRSYTARATRGGRSTADQETINATSVTNTPLQAMIDQGVTAALAARDAFRNTNGDDSHNSGTGVRRTERATRKCTYTDFLKCQLLPFKGSEGVASLSQWCERIESVFYISNCAVENQVKFATCTLHSVTLTWWNTHVKTVGHDAAYGMPWKTLMKMMTDKYCPRNEIKKLEKELWDLKVKGTDLASYTQRYQELALLCGRMFFEESDKIDKYIGGLPDMIHGSVVASKPKTMQEAVEITTELMDKKIRTFAERETTSKKMFENTSRNTQNQQQQSNKRQNTSRVYTAASGEKKQYGGSKPLCAKCNYHHDGPCAPKCHSCNKIGHFAHDCRCTANTNNANNQRGTGLGQKTTCYECGVQGNFKRECPKLKNINNHGNQGGRNNAPARVYAVGRAGTDPDANVVTGTFLLNNQYASVLFDTGAD
nr:hypothetical protein [Tanacetum cinerariifolium]